MFTCGNCCVRVLLFIVNLYNQVHKSLDNCSQSTKHTCTENVLSEWIEFSALQRCCYIKATKCNLSLNLNTTALLIVFHCWHRWVGGDCQWTGQSGRTLRKPKVIQYGGTVSSFSFTVLHILFGNVFSHT